MTEKDKESKKENKSEKKSKEFTIKFTPVRMFQVISVILAVALIAVLGMGIGPGATGCAVANPNTVGRNTLNFVNENLLPPEISANLVSAERSNDMYLINAVISGDYFGEEVSEPLVLFVSGDGKLLFEGFSAIDMSQPLPPMDFDFDDSQVEMDVADISHIVNAIEDNPEKVTIYYFYGEGCPFCDRQKVFLDRIEEEYPEIEIKSFETYYNTDNQLLYTGMAAAFEIRAGGVPGTFIGEESWVGFNDALGEEMENYIQFCIESGCPSAIEKIR